MPVDRTAAEQLAEAEQALQPGEREANETPERDAHRLRYGVIWTAILAVLMLGIAMAIPNLRDVIDKAGDAAPGWLVLGVALELASCLGYVATVRLVLARGPAREVRRLAWAEMAFGAVVPVGGAGSLAVGAWAMRAWGVPWSRVANRSAVIFLLTSAVNALVLGLAGLGVWLGIGTDRSGVLYGLVPAMAGFGALTIFMALPFIHPPEAGEARRHRLRETLSNVGAWVRDTERIASHPNWRLLGTFGYLLFDIAVLWACLRAVGVSAPILAVVVGYQVGYLAALIPVPGGIGVLDGGLIAALLLYRLPVTQTAAAVVLYHAIALWLPTIGGTIGFARLRRSIAGQELRVPPRAETRERPAAGTAGRAGVGTAERSGTGDGAGSRAEAPPPPSRVRYETRYSAPLSASVPTTTRTPAVNALPQRSSHRPGTW